MSDVSPMSPQRLDMKRLVPQRKLPHWRKVIHLCLAEGVVYLLDADTDLQEQGLLFEVLPLGHGKSENSCEVQEPNAG
jgi:hypothetical protein